MSDRREARDSQVWGRVRPLPPVGQEVATLLAEIEKIDAALARPHPLDRAA